MASEPTSHAAIPATTTTLAHAACSSGTLADIDAACAGPSTDNGTPASSASTSKLAVPLTTRRSRITAG